MKNKPSQMEPKRSGAELDEMCHRLADGANQPRFARVTNAAASYPNLQSLAPLLSGCYPERSEGSPTRLLCSQNSVHALRALRVFVVNILALSC